MRADANGNLPAPCPSCVPLCGNGLEACLPYGATVRVTILPPPPFNVADSTPYTVTIPLQPTVDLTQLILEDPPPPAIVTGITCTGCSGVVNPSPGTVGNVIFTVNGGNGFPLTADVSAQAHRITNLGPNIAPGDALSQGQSHLNDLNSATGNYSLAGNLLRSLGAPALAGDALGEGNCIGCLAQAAIIGNSITAKTNYQGVSQTLAETTGTLAPTHPSLLGGPDVLITIADNSNFTIANPTGVSFIATSPVLHWTIRILNNSGGSAGTITLGNAYEADSTWGAPANGMVRVCPVLTAYNGSVMHSYIGVCTGDLTY